jgi:hypothetical protein
VLPNVLSGKGKIEKSFVKTVNILWVGLAGFVLLAAGILKSYHLLTEPILSRDFWESWEFFLIQIPLELGLGIWLVSGLFRKGAWLVAVLCFGAFICLTLQKGLTGAESCGCFGKVHVNPWITLFAIDVPLFLGLLIFRPIGQKLLPPPWPSTKHFFGVAIPTCLFLGAIVPILILNKPAEKTERYEVVRPEEWVKKEPIRKDPTTEEQVDAGSVDEEATDENPRGEEWPLLKYIDIADSLRAEIVVVLFYHYDCPDCLEAISLYDQMNRDLSTNEGAIKISFVEVPPYGPVQESPIPPETLCLSGRLDPSKDWYLTTPLVVLIVDGLVVKSWEAKVPNLDEILKAIRGQL